MIKTLVCVTTALFLADAAAAQSVNGPQPFTGPNIVAIAGQGRENPSKSAVSTRWSIAPSMTFDLVCMTGILANDPYQTQFYSQQRSELVQLLPIATVEAGSRVHRAFKDAGVPTAGFLALVFSAAAANGLDELIAALENPGDIRMRLQASLYWNAERWQIFERIRPDLLTYVRGLRAARFPEWWKRGAFTEVENLLVTLRPRISRINLSGLIERKLGRPGPVTITVHATRFCRPFGARLLGDVFLIDVVGKKDPFRSVGAGAIHEMTHPPFDRKDPRIVRLTELLERDPTLADRFAVVHVTPVTTRSTDIWTRTLHERLTRSSASMSASHSWTTQTSGSGLKRVDITWRRPSSTI